MQKSGKLFVVPTPIGNLGDMTLRAVDVLAAVDVVLCEDTRVTGRLLTHFDMDKPLMRLDENTIRERADAIVRRIEEGERFAFCSDAGMPGVSDPGMVLVRRVREHGLDVEVLPGASAVVTAYVASGFANPRFLFAGFLPKREVEKRTVLEGLRSLDACLVFYESPHRLPSSLQVLAEVLPSRQVAVCRELTKLHEEVYADSSEAVAQEFARRADEGVLKGEVVLVLDGPTPTEEEQARAEAAGQASQRAAELVTQGLRPKEVAKRLVTECGLARNEAYAMALAARNGDDSVA